MSFDPDSLIALGRYEATLTDENGTVLAEFGFDNLITTTGKNLLLDQGLAASAYTAADFMGLISSASFSAVAAADTMTSHAGWLEAGTTNAPTMSSTRQTLAWSAAAGGVKGTSAPASFVFTGTGTVQGAFHRGRIWRDLGRAQHRRRAVQRGHPDHRPAGDFG
jgi:hypothetical protein